MKKIAFVLLLACIFVNTGCKHNAEKKTKTVYTKTDGNVYLVKVNKNKKMNVDASETGNISSVNSRSISNDINLPVIKYDNSILDAQNKQIIDKLNETLSNGVRSASGVDYSHVATGKNPTTYEKGNTRTFNSMVGGTLQNGTNGVLNVTCQYVGQHCYIFDDDTNKNKTAKKINLNYSNTDENTFKILADMIDKCYDLETQIIGSPVYNSYRDAIFVPSNEKIVILVSDLYGDANQPNAEGVAGYFYPSDMFSQTFLNNNDAGHIKSNQLQMFYIDSYFLSQAPQTIYSTLVHEFNHMINYVIKTVNYMTAKPNNNTIRYCDTWFTEMLAMVTEDMFINELGTPVEDSPFIRLPYFNLLYHYGFRNWQSQFKVKEDERISSAAVLYANTYAFGAFLARNFGGTALIKQIAQNEYIDEGAINNALNTLYPNQGIDYDYVIGKFPLILINTNAPTQQQLSQTGENQYYSLNRTVKEGNSKLYFKAVDLANIKVGNQTGIAPKFFSKNDLVTLGPNGFSVHYLGINIKSFELSVDINSAIDYYLVEQ